MFLAGDVSLSLLETSVVDGAFAGNEQLVKSSVVARRGGPLRSRLSAVSLL